jgi:predicted glycosyltransferase
MHLIRILSEYGKPLITSERPLSNDLEQFRLFIEPEEIHHYLGCARFIIGDSQTMSAEAAVLGTPYIRFNDFVGKIGYLEELENKYKLGYGIPTSQTDSLIEKTRELIYETENPLVFKERRELMLKDKSNAADFLFNYIINFLN